MTGPILVCTVGGSPAPIVTAIRAHAPAHVLFLVTNDATNPDGRLQPGSWRQLDGPQSIPAQTGLAAGSFEHVSVPADDPDGAFVIVSEALRMLRARFPGHSLIADYTGGTKSMSAAVLSAALAIPGVTMQIMAGARLDLVRVADGTERPFRIVPDFLLIERQATLLRDAWSSFGYAEAAEGFKDLGARLCGRPEAPPHLIDRVSKLATLSAAFAAWDRFDHARARSHFDSLVRIHAQFLAPFEACLDDLLGPEPTPHLLLDLWRNAERRALRGQYDDAVARCYRLLEWTGQWLLKSRHNIDTASVAWQAISQDQLAAAGICPRSGQKDLGGLMPAFRLLAVLEPEGKLAQFLKAPIPGDKRKRGINKLKDRLDGRNHSILAHGAKPLSLQDWNKFEAFMQDLFFPSVLHPELSVAGIAHDPPQLPIAPPPDL